MPEELSVTRMTPCAICHKPVELETAKTEERGWAVHEDCYMANLKQRRRLRVPGPQREEIASPSK
jgi:hypothetical protein